MSWKVFKVLLHVKNARINEIIEKLSLIPALNATEVALDFAITAVKIVDNKFQRSLPHIRTCWASARGLLQLRGASENDNFCSKSFHVNRFQTRPQQSRTPQSHHPQYPQIH